LDGGATGIVAWVKELLAAIKSMVSSKKGTISLYMRLSLHRIDLFLADKNLPMMLQEIQNVREHVGCELELFQDASVSVQQKQGRLMFLFMKDLMDGVNGEC
jgi:hypothetical protein